MHSLLPPSEMYNEFINMKQTKQKRKFKTFEKRRKTFQNSKLSFRHPEKSTRENR